MIGYFFLLVAAMLGLVLVLSRFASADPRKLAFALRMLGGIALMGVAAIFVARGLMIYAAPLAIAGYALMQGRSPLPSSFPGGSSRKAPGQQSRVATPYIEMRLDHDSGDMEGMVLKGKFAERMLSELALGELLALLGECRQHDGQGAQLLEAYIDRAHPDWRETAGEAAGDASGAEKPGGGPMSREEAYEILGLGVGAGAAEIRKAHRKLMKKMHPDHGGSNYLASKINEAKDLLLKQGQRGA